MAYIPFNPPLQPAVPPSRPNQWYNTTSYHALLNASLQSLENDRISGDAALQTQVDAIRDLAFESMQIYDTVAEGIADTAVGDQFRTTSSDPFVSYIVYEHQAGGVATIVTSMPAPEAVEDISTRLGDVRFGSLSAEEISFAITDEDGNSSDVELNQTGNITDRVMALWGPRLVPFLPPLTLDGITATDIIVGSGISFAITDEDGNSSDVELNDVGHFSDRVMNRMLAWFAARLPQVDLWDGPPARIVTIGDSLTAGAGGTAGNRWREVLSNLTGIPHDPMGVGGETARTITARTSALSMMITMPNDQIPSGTSPVDVSLAYQDGLAVAPLIQGSLGVNPCYALGVQGTLTRDGTSGQYRWSRAVAGDAVAALFPARLRTNAFMAYKEDLPIIGIGQNGGYVDLDDLIRMNWAMINFTSQGRAGRFLVWTRTGVNAATNAAMEERYLKEFGPRFVNIRARMSSLWAFEITGLTPTQKDLDAIAVGSVPPSFRSDAVHHNDYGQYVIAVSFYLAGLSLAFWS